MGQSIKAAAHTRHSAPAHAHDATRLGTAEPNLHLRINETEHTVGPGHCGITMGRGPNNAIVISDARVSRVQHLRCEFRDGQPMLIDWSKNGTYVVDEDGRETYLRKDAMPLSGAGTISLGRRPSKGQDLVYFSISS